MSNHRKQLRLARLARAEVAAEAFNRARAAPPPTLHTAGADPEPTPVRTLEEVGFESDYAVADDFEMPVEVETSMPVERPRVHEGWLRRTPAKRG